MKKILVSVSALALAMLASPVLADTNTSGTWGTGEDGKTEVTYTVPSTYTVVIPSTLAISAADTPVGATNNVFIKTSSQIADAETLTVSLAASQTFEAKRTGTPESSMPFTVSYAAQNGPTASAATDAPATTTAEIPILTQTGNQIAAVTDTVETTTGAANLSATVQAKATTAQIAQASKAGVHTGTIQFTVTKS